MNTEKILRAAIKLAAVCLTAPATLAVASSLYSEMGLFRWVVAGACLVLVEGALLLGWQLLDTQGKTATSGQRGLYAALVVVSYVVLWLVALAHGEGLAGIAFRSTLGVLIVYSLAEAGILANLKQDRDVLRDATRDRKVRRHQKRLAVKDAIASLDVEYSLKDKQRVYFSDEQCKAMELGHKAAMSNIKSSEDAIILKPKHSDGNGYPMPASQLLTIRDDKRATQKQQGLVTIAAARRANPDITQQALADMVGVSRQTVGKWLTELQSDNSNKQQLSFLTATNGNGHDRATLPVETN